MEPLAMKAKPCVEKMFEDFNSKRSLVIVANMQDPASKIYVTNKYKFAILHGVDCIVIQQEDYNKTNDLLDRVDEIREILSSKGQENVGIIFQQPYANYIDKDKVDTYLSENYYLDIDAIGGNLKDDYRTPCTPLGIMHLLDYYIGLNCLDGKNAVVIGRSEIVGRPIAQLLQNANCTVTVCHSHTSKEDLKFYTSHADIIVSAVGKANFITDDMVKDGAILVDVGINRVDGKVVGDFNPEAYKKAAAYTPVPGGVGPMTVATLVYKTGM